jgi:hypothetical protein
MRARSGWSHWSVPAILGAEYRADWEKRLSGSRCALFSDRATVARARELLGESGTNAVVSRADRILSGELPFFGKLWLNAGFPPSWFISARDGAHVDPERPWTSMGFYHRDYGDLKFILEPSRFLFVGELARAYLLTGDERYPSAFWHALEDWARHSPPATGPLWICGQESALRIVSWCLGWMAFRRASSTTVDRQAKLLSMVAAHGWRIEQTRIYAKSQRSNHIISEAVGLLTASLVFPELRWSGAWKQLAITELQQAVQDQFSPDGTYAQQSPNYQRMSLQLLAWSSALLRLQQSSLPADVKDRMLAARDFLLSVADPAAGRVPNSGANDGTLALPLDTCEYDDFRPTIQLVSKAVGSESKLPSGPWDEPGIWLFEAGSALEEKRHSACAETYRGFYLLRNSVSRVVLRCEDGHRRPYHADQLHLDIWWKGINLARDPGTYLYNGEPPWNNGLASTAVHNTVCVDGTDQMERAGRFLWRRWAHGRILEQGSRTLHAEHDGYRRLGILHHRAVADLAGRGWIVVDDLIGHGRHTASLNWLLPDLPVKSAQGPPFRATVITTEGRVDLVCLSSAPAAGYVVQRGKRQAVQQDADSFLSHDELRGWEASTYGQLDPALSVVFQTSAQMPLRLCSLFLFLPYEDIVVDLDSHVSLRWADFGLLVRFPPVGKKVSLSPERFT